ncbi:MAG: FtsX-like permease family protein, partial [Acidobacteria bacterium]|nr:FtsX-like permease family protein [Acidobacteriota bacterium]
MESRHCLLSEGMAPFPERAPAGTSRANRPYIERGAAIPAMKIRWGSRGRFGCGRLPLRKMAMIDGILGDLTSGFRVLRKRPGFTLIALITLATGIAASCAVFTVVESVLLRPLPYPEAGRLVIPRTRDKLTGNTYNITYPDFTTWKEEGVFEAVALRDPIRVDLTGDGEPARVRAMLVGDGYFAVVRKAALFGRTFLPEDHLPGAGPVLLLGEAFWRSRYGADPEALGRSARVNDVAHTIVGVIPDEAGAPYAIDVWVPRQPDPTDENLRDWDNHAFTAIARLKHGESLRSTNVVLDALAARTEEQYPALRAGETIIAVPLIRYLTGTDLDRALWILLGTAGFVLLIGCVNVANLMLTLAAQRGREIAVRTALGAGRFRLIRAQLVQGLVLAVGGGAVGLVLSLWLVDWLIALAPAGIPRLTDVGLNGPVLAFTVAISILSVGVFSLIPAAQTAGLAPAKVLNEGAFRSTAGRRAGRSRNLLIGLEAGLSLILLAGA